MYFFNPQTSLSFEIGNKYLLASGARALAGLPNALGIVRFGAVHTPEPSFQLFTEHAAAQCGWVHSAFSVWDDRSVLKHPKADLLARGYG